MVELRPKQQEVIDAEHQRFIHADPPGTGKTPTGWRWLSTWEAERSLIVAPRNVLRHWEGIQKLWAPEYETFVIPVGTSAVKRAKIREAFALDCWDYRSLVIPYSVLREDVDYLVQLGFDSMICDEAHKLKGRNTITSKAALKLARRSLILDLTTASPILNRAEEAWSSMRLIDPKRWPSFWRWAREHFHCYITTFGGRAARAIEMVGEPRDGALEAIAAEFGELLVMRSEEELEMDLPDVVETALIVDLTSAERRVYDQMAKHYWLEEGDTVVFAPNEVTKITRLRQLSSDWGGVVADELPEDGTKIKAAVELIEDELQGESVVVFCWYKSTARRLVALLRKNDVSATTYTGDENDDQRAAALEAFASKEVQVLVGTDSTMAESLDGLQFTSNHMIVLDPDWVPEAVRQKVGRLKRQGQVEHTVYVWYILARDTIDQYVEAARDTKQEMLDIVVGRNIKDVLEGKM